MPKHSPVQPCARHAALPQAAAHDALLLSGWPTPAEVALLRWAANSTSVAAPPHVTKRQYKQATALEVLVRSILTARSRRAAAPSCSAVPAAVHAAVLPQQHPWFGR